MKGYYKIACLLVSILVFTLYLEMVSANSYLADVYFTVPDNSQTYSLGELNQEQTLEIIKGDHIKFSIANENYILTLEDNSNSEASISVGTKTFSLNVGAEINLDLNDNGVSEFYIKLRGINLISGKAKLTLNLAG